MTTRTDSRNTSPSDPPRRTYDRDTIDRLKRTTGIAPFRTRLKQWRKNGKEYKAICPFHDDHNPSLSVYRDKVSGQSRFKCFSCGKSGDTLDLVQHIDHVDLQTAIQKLASEVGFDLPASDSAEPVLPAFSYDWREGTERLLQDESALRYLSSRGIVDKRLISENKIGLCEAARLGLSLVFPYEIDESSGKVTAKLRALGDNVPDGKKFSHFTGTKTATLLFNEKALDSFIYGNESIFVTESELDCLMMEQQGYRAVSVSSASACAKKVNDIEQITIEPHFIEQLRDAHSIFILTDMDDAGNKCAGLLMEAIGRPSKTFRIRWDYGGKGSGQPKDIGDLARQLGGDSDKFRSKIESLCEEAKVPILWRQAPTLGEIPHREPSWLVPDLVPYGELTFLTGDFGSFKSYMSWFVADAVSQGGIFADRVCAKHPVLILDRENSHSTVSLRRYLVGNLKSNPDVRFLGNFTSPRVCDVDDSRLIEVCKQIRPLIILDSFADFHPGLSESDPDDMVQFTQKLLNLTASGAAGVIALHHIPKAGTGKGKNYRGTTAIPAAGGAAILVEKENKTGVTLSGFKNRDGEELVVRLEMVFRKDNVSYRVLSSGKDEAAILRDAVQRFIHDHPNCGVKEVANGISKRPEDVGETIKEMERTGVLVPRPKIRSGQKIELRCNCSDCQPSKAVPENLERLLIQ